MYNVLSKQKLPWGLFLQPSSWECCQGRECFRASCLHSGLAEAKVSLMEATWRACYFSLVTLGVRVFRKQAMPRRIVACSWTPPCSRLPQCLVQVSESCSSGPLCCPWQIPAMPTGWGAQLQGGSGAQHFPPPKEPIAVCVRKPDGSIRLLALEQDTLHLTFRNIYN